MAGGAMGPGGGGGGGGNTSQSLSQLNTILNQLGGGAGSASAGQGQFGALPALTNLGGNMMKAGMQPPSAAPQGMPRPVMGGGGMGPGVPVPQGAAPQMGGGQGMPIGLMNMALARQNGMYPGFR